jgi:hypothetical protein
VVAFVGVMTSSQTDFGLLDPWRHMREKYQFFGDHQRNVVWYVTVLGHIYMVRKRDPFELFWGLEPR